MPLSDAAATVAGEARYIRLNATPFSRAGKINFLRCFFSKSPPDDVMPLE
jgi:hypothetical protein